MGDNLTKKKDNDTYLYGLFLRARSIIPVY